MWHKTIITLGIVLLAAVAVVAQESFRNQLAGHWIFHEGL
jgi:hypothetical protein